MTSKHYSLSAALTKDTDKLNFNDFVEVGDYARHIFGHVSLGDSSWGSVTPSTIR